MSDDGAAAGQSDEARDSEGDPADGEATERYEEVLHAEGHEHVQGTHTSTFEVTTDDYLTPAGDCIVGIEADRAPSDFDDAFVTACQDADARIVTTLAVRETGADGDDAETSGDDADGSDGGIVGTQEIEARGDPELTFESERSAVWRTSDYVDERTVAVGAEGAAAEIDRDLIEALAEGAELDVEIAVVPPL